MAREEADYGPKESAQHGEVVLVDRFDPKGFRLGFGAKRLTHIERMTKSGVLEEREAFAAERFARDFHLARLGGNYASINMFRVMGGNNDRIAEKTVDHRMEVKRALDELGNGLQGSIVWDVCGCGESVSGWAKSRVRPLHNSVATGILIAALDTLAVLYGYGHSERKSIPA